ncbi:helix-turn-helix transcriptional regulator [Cohnella boryungensis]|uniref:Helix-turn-helix transcriptional regulator n=1 Tax=Cohnella boryungensis TaxID=768479 RepID=A0ABV8SDW7_9BACL
MDIHVFFEKWVRDYGLTRREQEVAVYWMQDHTYKEIAALLTISEFTTRTIIHNIHLKMGVKSKASLLIKMVKEKTLTEPILTKR